MNLIGAATRGLIAGTQFMEKKLGDDIASTIYSLLNTSLWFSGLAFTRLYVKDANPVQIQFWRGLVQLVMSVIAMKEYNIPAAVKGSVNERLRMLRNLIGATQVLFVLYAVQKMPISDINVLYGMAPFVVAFFDRLWLKAEYQMSEGVLALVNTLGVIAVIKPDMFSGENPAPSDGNYQYAVGSERLFWQICAIVVVLCWSFGNVVVKRLKGMNPVAMNFPFGIIIMFEVSLYEVATGEFGDIGLWMTLKCILILGVFGFFTQMTFVKALQLGKPGRITILNNMNLVYSFIFEALYLDEYPPFLKIVGALMVTGSSILLVLNQMKRA